jgi:hypothetical protein
MEDDTEEEEETEAAYSHRRDYDHEIYAKADCRIGAHRVTILTRYQ